MMTPEQLRAVIGRRPDVEERETWGHPTFRVQHKVFVGIDPGGTTARVKASEQEQAALVATDPVTFSVASYVGRHGWVDVQLDTVDPDEMSELVVEAWRSTAPVPIVAEFDSD